MRVYLNFCSNNLQDVTHDMLDLVRMYIGIVPARQSLPINRSEALLIYEGADWKDIGDVLGYISTKLVSYTKAYDLTVSKADGSDKVFIIVNNMEVL